MNATVSPRQVPVSSAVGGQAIYPTLDDNGRITLPGSLSGLSSQAYLTLLHHYAASLTANRVLDCHRQALAQKELTSAQCAITQLQGSHRLPGLFYKREDQTVTQAYKVRGALVCMANMMEQHNQQAFLAVSTGNHALGVLKAAELLKPQSVQIAIPQNTAPAKRDKINSAIQAVCSAGVEASCLIVGDTFDACRDWALASLDTSRFYLDPYSDFWVVAGQGTIGLELWSQLRPVLLANPKVKEVVLLAPVGGGGLLAGTATALQLAACWDHSLHHVSLRFVGLRLQSLQSQWGDAIKVKQVAPGNQVLFDYLGVTTQLITDEQMHDGMAFVRQDSSCEVEGPSGATVIPALTQPSCQPTSERWVVALLSGGNV